MASVKNWVSKLSKDRYKQRSHFTDDDINVLRNILKIVGYKIPRKYSAVGTAGFVFDLSKDRVLKITSDPKETKIAAGLKDLNLKHAYKIYRVFTIRSLIGKGIYFIEQEKLNKLLNEKEKNAINFIFGRFSYKDAVKIFKEFERLKDEYEYIFEPGEKSYIAFDTITNLPNLKKLKPVVIGYIFLSILHFGKNKFILDSLTEDNYRFFNKIVDAIKEMYDNGIRHSDLVSGNVMKDNKGTIKFIDFGYESKAKGKKGRIEIIKSNFNNKGKTI